MPAIADIVINDGQATPVSHTFGYQSTLGNSVRFAEPGLSKASEKTLTYTRKEVSGGVKYTVSVVMPIVNDIGSGGTYVPQVVRTLRSKTEYFIPDNATAGEIADAHAFGTFSQNQASVLADMMSNDQGLY